MATEQGAPLRRVRERDLIAATRALFDEHGMQHAPVEEIARAAGIARGLIYRHFASKEELFVLTVTTYLDELAGRLAAVEPGAADPMTRAGDLVHAYATYCQEYPAFLDASLSLMQRPARDLRERVSGSVWLRLGQGMARCLDPVAATLRDGVEAGVFAVEDPDFAANLLWTQTLGAMHLARIGVGVRMAAPGVPALFEVAAEDVVAACVRSALTTIAPPPA
jgi:AcrR family transcriptional regulator